MQIESIALFHVKLEFHSESLELTQQLGWNIKHFQPFIKSNPITGLDRP
jgi:hypothetical protein